MLNGLRDTPISNNHMRVLDLVGHGPDDPNCETSVDLFPCKKQKLVDLANQPSTSSSIYRVPSTSRSIYHVPSTSSGIYHAPSTHRPMCTPAINLVTETGLHSAARVPMSTPATGLQSAITEPMSTPVIGFRAASGVRTGDTSLRQTPQSATRVTSEFLCSIILLLFIYSIYLYYFFILLFYLFIILFLVLVSIYFLSFSSNSILFLEIPVFLFQASALLS